MKKKSAVRLSTVFSVEGLYSVHHIDLTRLNARGELHDFYELVYVESGYYYVILDGERFTVPPGSVIFFAPNAFHSGDGVTRSTATVDILSFTAESPAMRYFDNRVFALDESQRAAFFSTFEIARQALEQIPHEGLRIRDGVRPTALQELKSRFELFLLALYDDTVTVTVQSNRAQYRKERFRQISDYMKANLDRPITLPEIAADCSVSVTGLKELCRTFCGCGPIDYLISLRILAAKELIRGSTMNFSEIAERTGFSSLHYFSRTFKARTGMSPSEYARVP